MSDFNCKRICLWSGPRNISTALMYAFAQRPDTKVYDEPLYGYYLKTTPAKEYHPGADEVMDSIECDPQKVVDMMMGPHETPVVFFKNMGHHLGDIDRSFMASSYNLILTRHPAQVIESFAKEIPNPSLLDVGFRAQAELLDDLIRMGAKTSVIDSNQILKDPMGSLSKLCVQMGVPFYKEMLHWEAGPRPEDGVWARHWYANVHASTGFGTYIEKPLTVASHLEPLLQECMPYYNRLIDATTT
ncbi:MAG: sulfotransferase-like domain-containing protein [Arcticibacter sp.]